MKCPIFRSHKDNSYAHFLASFPHCFSAPPLFFLLFMFSCMARGGARGEGEGGGGWVGGDWGGGLFYKMHPANGASANLTDRSWHVNLGKARQGRVLISLVK